MAAQIPVLDIQEDSLLLLHPSGKKPRCHQTHLPPGLFQQGRITDPDTLSALLRKCFLDSGLSHRRCILVLPRQSSDPLQAVLKQSGIRPLRVLTGDEACLGLLGKDESACLVIPDGSRFQAIFAHQGTVRMRRSLEDPQPLTQILLIYRFSNPEAPISRVYLPGSFSGSPEDGWELHPLEDLLPDGVPPEAAVAAGGLSLTSNDSFSWRPTLGKRQIVLLSGLILTGSLFLHFGIFQPLAARNAALAELESQQSLTQRLSARLEAYDSLSDAFLRTGGGILTESEQALADRIAVLDLVEQVICPRATVTEFTLSGNSLTLHLTEISLQSAGTLVSQLKDHPLIAQAQLHSAEADSGETSSIYLRITLKEGES